MYNWWAVEYRNGDEKIILQWKRFSLKKSFVLYLYQLNLFIGSPPPKFRILFCYKSYLNLYDFIIQDSKKVPAFTSSTQITMIKKFFHHILSSKQRRLVKKNELVTNQSQTFVKKKNSFFSFRREDINSPLAPQSLDTCGRQNKLTNDCRDVAPLAWYVIRTLKFSLFSLANADSGPIGIL